MEFDESKPEPIVTPDTPNETKFNPNEAPLGYRLDGSESYEQLYSTLRLYNRGTHTRAGNCLGKTQSDKAKIRLADNLGIYDAVACQLDLPGRQKRWAKELFKRLPYKRFSQPHDGGKGIALAAFCACSYVCWQCGWRTHPNQPDRHAQFKKIQGDFGFTDRQFQTWYGRFENQIRRN